MKDARTFVRRVESIRTAAGTLAALRDFRVLATFGPATFRGILQPAHKCDSTDARTRHMTHFDWNYRADSAELEHLYSRSKSAQWDGELHLPWSTEVDPDNPETPLLPDNFFDFQGLEALGVRLDRREKVRFRTAMVTWMLSQFLHGEQGALYAAAQVVESMPLFSGKKLGSTQVMDEARHVEVFARYLHTKLGKRYPINDKLFVVIDTLVRDPRWDVKFLGMQVMVEGLALTAFGNLCKQTEEPLLKALLQRILEDEARHVQFGLLALKRFLARLTDAERRERDEWAFEAALLMRDRFHAYEVYDEWFGHRFSSTAWRRLLETSPGMEQFRRIMFRRLARNLKTIGLLNEPVQNRWVRAGLQRVADRGGPASCD